MPALTGTMSPKYTVTLRSLNEVFRHEKRRRILPIREFPAPFHFQKFKEDSSALCISIILSKTDGYILLLRIQFCQPHRLLCYKELLFPTQFKKFQSTNGHYQYNGKHTSHKHARLQIIPCTLALRPPQYWGQSSRPSPPAMASRANIAVPPRGILRDEMLMVPGHMMPTENPHSMQPIRPNTGFPAVETNR